MPSDTILKHIFHFFSSDKLLGVYKMVDRMNLLMWGIRIKDLKFEHPDDPHGEGVNHRLGEPGRILEAT